MPTVGQQSNYFTICFLPRTSAALGFAQYTPQDKKLYSPEELMDRMCMALGGRVAESLTFNKITTGKRPSLYYVSILFALHPIHLVSINTVLSVSKTGRFQDPPTLSFC